MGNTLKTTLLLGLLTGLIVWIGGYFGGQGGIVIAFLFAVIMNFGAYWFSDKIVLRMYRAREVDPTQAPELYRMVERLAQKAGIPTPKVFVIPSESPNAFATGRNPEHAVVAVTQGILQLMNDEELEGVIAHELGHVKNRDILISSIAATLAGAIMVLASMARWAAIFGGFSRDDDDGGGIFGLLFMAILAPLAAMMIQMAISRTREYKADATAAEVTGTPYGLAHALEKLGKATQRIPMEANPSTAHMFIVNPLAGRSMMKLFSTHPPLEDRIRRLLGR
jgi:heat shock protein HtpX